MNKKLIDWWQGGIVSSYDSDYQAVLDKGTALGATLPSDSQKAKQNTLMIDLKSLGLWALADVIRLYATDGNNSFALINWKDPDSFLGTISGSLTFTTNVGFTAGNGTNYIDDNYNPSTDGVNFTQNNASIMYYKNGAQSISTPNGHIQSADDVARLQPRRSIDLMYYKLNGGSALGAAQSDDGNGLWATDYDITNMAHQLEIYKFGSKLTGGNVTSTGRPNGMRNCWYGNDKSAFVCYGASTRAIQAAIDTALDTYLASL